MLLPRATRLKPSLGALAARLAPLVVVACSGGSASSSLLDAGLTQVPPPDAHPIDGAHPPPIGDAGRDAGEASLTHDTGADGDATSDATAGVTDGASDVASDGTSERSPDAKGDVGRPDASDAGEGGFVAAAHTLPIIPDEGGPELTHPLLVSVTYANDSQRAFVEQLGAYLVTSPWLTAVGPEYGIAHGTHQNVELPMSAPSSITSTEIEALVESLVHAGTLPDSDAGVLARELPRDSDGGLTDAGPDPWDGGGDGGPPVRMPPIIYMMYFPATTAITIEGSALCDVTGGGYHYQTPLSSYGQAFSFAVITECPGSDEAELVQATSHEFIEASTDPSQGDYAYSISDLADPWSYFGGEVGDLCSLLTPQWSEGGYSGIQRVYSDKAASEGGDPCLPAPEPYYGTGLVPGTAQEITPGGMLSFDITGWSSAPVAEWSLLASAYISSPSSFIPVFHLSTMTLNNGGTATMTVTVPAEAASGSYAFGLLYSYHSQTDYTTSLIELYVP
jgi:hypothetical protein